MKKLWALLAAVSMLAACTALPSEGPVHATRAPSDATRNVGLHANGPSEGATPEEIVQGFLTASGAGPSNDFAVARQFLSQEASANWRPLTEVRIYSDSRVPVTTRTETQGVRLSLGSEGSLDEDGRFTSSSRDAVITTDFSLARNSDGEWRIIDLEDGLLISATLFDSQYAKSELYFLTSDSRYLVADIRWFPRNTYATSAAIELFAGPAPWLASAVHTAIPPNTTIGTRGISIDNGLATVSLSEEALSVTGYQRILFEAQVEETLTMLSNVQDVELTIDGAPWQISSGSAPSTYPFTDSRTLVLVAGQPSLFRDGTSVGLNMASTPENLHSLAMGYGEDPLMVGISGNRLVTLPNDGTASRTLYEGPELIPPSVDIYDWVWSGRSNGGGTITVADPEGETIDISVPWLEDGLIDSIHVSREGARAVIVWQTETTTYLTAVAIVRDGEGRPISLGEPFELGSTIDSVTDVAWIDETTVAALATLTGSNSPAIYSIPIGGPIHTITEANGATHITAGNGEDSIIVATENGQILERSGGGWKLLLTDGSDPALAG
ncbi:MAG: LpqB family beta-propeller domain-containing protein [Flaviflexus sp.]|uniref:LpqB family beta-propeller domain-containing protein n=1 Tax=Flaviflexus sp. TaxID=1969482 RepID=UPI00352E38FF